MRRRRLRFIRFNRRHRWLEVRKYKYRTLYRCRVCGRWARRGNPDALMEATRRMVVPRLVEMAYRPSATMSRLMSPVA